MKIKVSKDYNEAKLLAEEARKNRLFVSGWSLNGIYKAIVEGAAKGKVALCYVDNKPVGAAVAYSYDFARSKHICCFVRKNYRRKGIGSALINSISIQKNDLYAVEGAKYSPGFFAKNGIHMY